MIIRQETNKDFGDVYSLIKTAFATAEHCDGNEQDLVTTLRKSEAYVSKLSLVAEINNKIVGYIMFTKASVGKDIVLVLAPLAILPDYQKQGIGSSLIKEGHRIARELNYHYSFVLGSEYYYPKFGYIPAKRFSIEVPNGIPSINFMAMQLQENAKPISGILKCAPEFNL